MRILNIISLLLCGSSIGWLIGLSTSPTIQTVIGSLLAIITSILTVLFSLQDGQLKDKISDKLGVINVFPLAAFLIGLSITATIGIYARTNDWFGVNPQSCKRKCELKDKDTSGIIKSLYNELHNQDSKETNNINRGVLFNNSESCNELLKISDLEILISELQSLGPDWQSFADSVQNNIPKKEQILMLKQRIIQSCK